MAMYLGNLAARQNGERTAWQTRLRVRDNDPVDILVPDLNAGLYLETGDAFTYITLVTIRRISHGGSPISATLRKHIVE